MTPPVKPYLPGVLHQISKEISQDCAIALAKARGGREVWIPKAPAPGHALVEIIGLANARKLSKLLGSGNVMIPCGNIGGAAGRRARIIQLFRDGWSNSEIAAEVDVHVRTVERVVQEQGGRDTGQLDLFSDP